MGEGVCDNGVSDIDGVESWEGRDDCKNDDCMFDQTIAMAGRG